MEKFAETQVFASFILLNKYDVTIEWVYFF